MADEKKELTVKTPMGTIVVYPSNDPLNPGVFIDLRREGIDFMLNLACVECKIDEDGETAPVLALHAWEKADHEDTTIDTTFQGVDEYFDA